MSDTRQHVIELLDRLTPAELAELEKHLESKLAAEAEERAVEEAREWVRQNPGRGVSHEEVLADFGLTMEDFQRMGEERAKRRSPHPNGKTD